MPEYKASLIVFVSGMVVSASFMLSNGRTEWYMLEILYRIFGNIVLSTSGFLLAGTILYLLLWIYISIATYFLLRIFGNQASLKRISNAISKGFFLPQVLVLPFSFFNYYVHMAGLILFIFLLPVSITPYSLRESCNADFYRRSISFMLSLYLMLIFWTNIFEPLGVI